MNAPHSTETPQNTCRPSFLHPPRRSTTPLRRQARLQGRDAELGRRPTRLPGTCDTASLASHHTKTVPEHSSLARQKQTSAMHEQKCFMSCNGKHLRTQASTYLYTDKNRHDIPPSMFEGVEKLTPTPHPSDSLLRPSPNRSGGHMGRALQKKRTPRDGFSSDQARTIPPGVVCQSFLAAQGETAVNTQDRLTWRRIAPHKNKNTFKTKKCATSPRDEVFRVAGKKLKNSRQEKRINYMYTFYTYYEVDKRSRLAASSCSNVGGVFFPATAETSCELPLQCVPNPWPSLLLNCYVRKALEPSYRGRKQGCGYAGQGRGSCT